MKKEDSYWTNREFIDDLINQLPASIFWKNTSSVFLGCNKYFAYLAGLPSPKDIIGKTDYDLPWGEHEGDLYRKDDQEVMQSKQPKFGIEESQTLTNGKTIILLTNKIPLLSKKNVVVGILGIFHDITARKEMEQSLEKAKNQAETANEAKTAFIANMSHDIRTPLSGIVGMSELLEEEVQNPKQKQYAHWINKSGNQLLGLLNGILDVVASENVDELNLHEETYDLRDCINDIVQLERPTIALRKLILKIDIDNKVPQYIRSDCTKLHRILLNLLSNAIKFIETGSIIINVKCLSKTEDTAELQFSVTDTGIGIPDELQDKVFDRFFRASPSFKGTYVGNGVGLHIAQSYVKLLGGELKLSSQEGVGTSFFFDLSCKIANTGGAVMAPYEETTTLESMPTIERLSDNKRPYLLLVEDNKIALHMLESMAFKAGCRFISVMNGEKALELAQSVDFDLIVTDIGLPGISGHEFTRRLRDWEIQSIKKPAPIVGLSAHAREQVMNDCLKAGMNDVHTKPINLMMLQTMVNQFVSSGSYSNGRQNKAYPPQIPTGLGADLPDSEEQLFNLYAFPLLDIKSAIESLGNENLLHEILGMQNNDILKDAKVLEEAYAYNNWETIEKLAHKLKGGAFYSGTIRMRFACQYLERYQKTGNRAMLEKLYHQLMGVLKETQYCIERWLNS